MNLNALLRPSLPHQGDVAEDLQVGFGKGGLNDASWPEAALPDLWVPKMSSGGSDLGLPVIGCVHNNVENRDP
jgi:hypothetical protein